MLTEMLIITFAFNFNTSLTSYCVIIFFVVIVASQLAANYANLWCDGGFVC